MTSELILLVDDEPSIIQLARMYLERENFRIEAVDTFKLFCIKSNLSM